MAGPGLVAPPRVRAQEPERTATRLELFFDLAFVIALGELALHFDGDLDLDGWLWSIGTFAALWWVWAGFTVYANRFDSDDVVYRLVKLSAMGAVLGCAAALPSPPVGIPTSFVLCYAVTQVLLALLYLRAGLYLTEARPVAAVYLVGLGAGTVLWLAALANSGGVRTGLAIAAAVVAAAAPVIGRHRTAAVTLHLEHLPERVGLLVILVLGEVASGVVLGLKKADWSASSVVAAVLAFVLGAALWWLYFDAAGAATTRSLRDATDGDVSDEDRSTSAFDIYLYGQLPATLGLVIAGVGIDHAIAEAGEQSLKTSTLLPMCLGVAVYLLALAGTQAALRGDASVNALWPAGGAAALLALIFLGPVVPPTVTVGFAAAVVVGTLAGGLHRKARGALPVTDASQ